MIEHTQLLWNVAGGTPVRIPVYSVLIEHDDGLFLFDTGIDLDHMNRVLPFELPEQTPEQTIPAQLEACGFSLGDVTTLVNSHLHIDHVGGNKLFPGTRTVIHEKEVAQARDHEPFEFFGYSDKSWDYEGLNLETVSGRHRAGQGDLPVRDARPHGRALLAAAQAGRRAPGRCSSRSTSPTPPAAMEKGIQPGFHNNPRRRRPLDPPRQGARRRARCRGLLLARHGRLAHLPPRPRRLRDLEGPPR